MAFNRGILVAVLVVVTAAELVGNAAAATYVVGDSLGWTVPPAGASAYVTWASQHVFRVGDVLVFNFATGQHDVAKVTNGAFGGCSSNSPIALETVGPANFTLNSTGEHYYICTFGQHCSLGQKLAINVTAPSTSPAPAPAPSAPPTTPSPTPTPPLTPSPSPSPPPSPGSTPAPTPSGSATPPPSPGSEASPGATPPVPTGDLSPPPPPPPPANSATITAIRTPFLIFASIAFGLIM